MPDGPQDPGGIVHATTVSVDGHGVLIRGAAGTGKSSLALQLMAYGAELVADDRTMLWRESGGVFASAPEEIAGMIEARGIGILYAEPTMPVPVVCVIELDLEETERLPPHRTTRMLGFHLPCLHKSMNPAWPAAVMQYLRAGRQDIP